MRRVETRTLWVQMTAVPEDGYVGLVLRGNEGSYVGDLSETPFREPIELIETGMVALWVECNPSSSRKRE